MNPPLPFKTKRDVNFSSSCLDLKIIIIDLAVNNSDYYKKRGVHVCQNQRQTLPTIKHVIIV
jgi:hypothetical protein